MTRGIPSATWHPNPDTWHSPQSQRLPPIPVTAHPSCPPSLRLRLRAVTIADRLAEDGEEEWGEEGEASDDDEEAAPWR